MTLLRRLDCKCCMRGQVIKCDHIIEHRYMRYVSKHKLLPSSSNNSQRHPRRLIMIQTPWAIASDLNCQKYLQWRGSDVPPWGHIVWDLSCNGRDCDCDCLHGWSNGDGYVFPIETCRLVAPCWSVRLYSYHRKRGLLGDRAACKSYNHQSTSSSALDPCAHKYRSPVQWKWK